MKEFDLKKYLSKYKNTSVDFFRFPGNYGDSLIWHGTKKLLSLLNISERYVDISSPKYNDVLFIDGGGNFVDYYSDVKDFLIKKPALYSEIVILPHTIFGEKQIEVLNNISSNLTIFCREKVSAKFLKDKIAHGKVYLWHDCAFYNEFSQIPVGDGVLSAFRSDNESILNTWPESNNDLSYSGYATKPLNELIGVLQKYAQVNTDRLHIAIGSTLLGKQVKLFPNSYYKNKAVFDYSLKKFPNISFVENLITNNMLNFETISKIFSDFLDGTPTVLESNTRLSNLIRSNIETNQKLWNLEDSARMIELGSEHVAITKREIDKNNQIRNDLIGEIDVEIANQIRVVPLDSQEQFYSESPGMIIDRLAILYIKLSVIRDLLSVIKEEDLEKEYRNKKNIILRQIDRAGNFLNSYFNKLEHKEAFFDIQQPVKIYNDKKIKKYIRILEHKRKDLPNQNRFNGSQ